MANSGITFVTSILHIYEQDYDEKKTIPWRIERFQELVDLGLKLCVYVSPEMEPLVRPIEAAHPNTVKIMRVLNCEDTIVAKMLATHCPDYRLPSRRNEGKDQAKYNIVINSKTEFMTDAVVRNPWNSSHFAWIDFNITYVFFDKQRTMAFLKWLASQQWIAPKCFAIAGCGPWQPYFPEYPVPIHEGVYWRFCGGFFLGDANSIRRFHTLYQEYFPKFLREYQTLVWEVNFWAWLEVNSDWHPTWYAADHNDSIVCNIPIEIFTRTLGDAVGAQKITYQYPGIKDQYEAPYYFASSASYLETSNGRHLLNTRYVNYWHDSEGQYQFFRDPPNYIRNLNFCSELDENMMPLRFTLMDETIDLPKHEFYSRGIEDVRLYEFRGKVRYIATTVNYYHTQGNRMIVGDYCQYHYENSRIVESPEGNHLEKNWAPVAVRDPASAFHDRELFVYKWSPFTVGELCGGELAILERFETHQTPFFHKLKGSTQFVDTGEYLVGVAHFTEEARPRKYFHMLVALDRVTLRPVRYSDPFCFEHVSIEFCIGFAIRDGSYWFWISRMDRDPMLIRVGMDAISLDREVVGLG